MDVDLGGHLVGWSFRLAGRIAAAQDGLLYANLAVRGATTRDLMEQQLDRALAMRPDLATVFSGTNDVLRARFDAAAFAADVLRLQSELRRAGATVLTFTLPDLAALVPLARFVSPRIRAMNDAVRAACATTGTRLVDFATVPIATDPRLWNADRIHANSMGHARIAEALAEALGLPGSDRSWREPLATRPRLGLLGSAAGQLGWCLRFLLPWSVAALLPGRPARRSEGRRPRLAPFDDTLLHDASPVGLGEAGSAERQQSRRPR